MSVSGQGPLASERICFIIRADDDLLTISKIKNDVSSVNLESLVEAALHELNDYGTLESGWDGYRAEPIDSSNLLTAIDLVSFIYRYFAGDTVVIQEITPGPVADGSVDIEIKSNDKCLVFNISNYGMTMGIYKKDEIASSEDAPIFSWERVEEELSWFHGTAIRQVTVA
ncbi:MAG: hypothetical protein U1E10_07185 [Bdellovibrionales bacterium]|nr:hypothetical protein [Bdellovibrionales bacterium]